MKITRIFGFFLLCGGVYFLDLVQESGWRYVAGAIVGLSMTMLIWPKSLPWNKENKSNND